MTANDKNAESFLTDKDQHTLSLTDPEYQPHTWENLKELISSNNLHLLTRYPSQLKKYMQWSAEIKLAWGSVTNFILKNRLYWEPSPPELCQPGSMFAVANPRPLSDPGDYKILINDWPYGLDKGISHIIIWLKHRFQSSTEKGDLTPEDREIVESFVKSRFCTKLGTENVLWFRNWPGIQSVRSLEHFHVLLRNADGRLEEVMK